ncbi:MAG: cytochrome P450 [Kiloniellales bacterium]
MDLPLLVGRSRRSRLVLLADRDAVRTVLFDQGQRFEVPRSMRRAWSQEGGGRHSFLFMPEETALHRPICSSFLDVRRLDALVQTCESVVERAASDTRAFAERAATSLEAEIGRIVLASFWRHLFRVDDSQDLSPEVLQLLSRADGILRTGGTQHPLEAITGLASIGLQEYFSPLDPEIFAGLGLQGYADELLRAAVGDNARVLLATSNETTASAITWALWFLASDRDLQDRLRAEALNARRKGDQSGLIETKALMNECLRLLPPAAVTSRRSVVEQELCGAALAPGDWVVIPFYVLHRHRSAWQEPDRFRPERFMPASEGSLLRGAFYPFSAGPFACGGSRFGWRMIVTVLASLLCKWEVQHMPDSQTPCLDMGRILHPRDPIKLRFRHCG